MAINSPLNELSSSVAPITILDCDKNRLGSATGFFYKNSEGNYFFITNWHVATGRNQQDISLSKKSVPCYFNIELFQKFSEDGKSFISLKHTGKIEIDINSKCGENPEWIEHPEHKYKVDIIALKITPEKLAKFKETFYITAINECRFFDDEYKGEPMDDAFVIGYPWGIKYAGSLPLYKKGSIASETLINYTRLPKFLIDCRTSESMSGSPVIGKKLGFWHKDGILDEKGKMRGDASLDGVKNFLGIFSGRLRGIDSEEISEIGVVWKKELLDEIVDNGIEGMKLSEILECI